MSFMLSRMFAYFTLAMYLVVGVVVVRVSMPEMTTVSLSTNYLSIFSKTSLEAQESDLIVAPKMLFAEIKIPVEKKVVVSRPVIAKPIVVETIEVAEVIAAPKLEVVTVEKNELPFKEPVTLQKIVMNIELPVNHVALYQDFTFKEAELVAESMTKEDQVSTKLAKSEEVVTSDAEPDFFEYENTVAETKIPEIASDVDPVVGDSAPVAVSEEIAVDDLVAFDYSKANADIKSQTMPVVTTVTTQGAAASEIAKPAPVTTMRMLPEVSSKRRSAHNPAPQTNPVKEPKGIVEDTNKMNKAVTTHPTRVSIQVVSTNLKQSQDERGFEIRFQDDQSEAIQDYSNGFVTIDQIQNTKVTTRSATVLKRGFAPTNSDLIMEDGLSASIPLIEEEAFNEQLLPFEARGPIGAVLVELDGNTDGAFLDVPYSKVINLDDDLRMTDEKDSRYQFFIGVKAGNALLGYKSLNGEVVSKIIHIHEREVTFDSYQTEVVSNEKVRLFEEDLLGKEKAPLIIASEDVRQFASDKTGKKLNNHTYKMDFNSSLLGSRRYLELTHHEEPIFVGIGNKTDVKVPSERFMRYILGQFEGSHLGNRCLVQVNLAKKASKVDVGAESIDSGLATYTQILDRDGKFYESISDKSEKVIVVGEYQGSEKASMDSKINLKVTYEDGSVDYLGSYCSPNTYLVEQL